MTAAAAAILAAPAQAASGTWNRSWGKDVVTGNPTGFEICTVAARCQMGDPGGLGGELNGPNGLATDSAGNVYVADHVNFRIQKFDSAGHFKLAWGKNVVAGAPDGYEICTAAASCKAGEPGDLGGEFDEPVGLATDSAGNVYVADQGNERIQKFDSAGGFKRAWGSNVDSANPGTGFEKCDVAANCVAGDPGGAGGAFDVPDAVDTDGAGNVYVAERDNTRVQKFNSAGDFLLAWGKNVSIATPGSEAETCNVASDCQPGGFAALGGEFDSPSGIATGAAGDIYVAELSNNRIQRFDLVGNFISAWGKDVVMGAPTGFEVCTDPAICQLGDTDGVGGELNLTGLLGPAGVATDASGNVYVADEGNFRVQKFGPTGNFVRAWGKDVVTGTPPGFEVCTAAASCQAGNFGGLGGELDNPAGIATDTNGNVYVSDFNERISKFADPVPSPSPSPPPPSGGALPSNEFSIGKVKHRKLRVEVASAGIVEVNDAAAGDAGASALAKKRVLKPSSATGGPGTVKVNLRLTKRAKKKLKRKGTVKAKSDVTFTPNGGLAASRTTKLKVKK
jgi:DNA-binding beta-propeller fold protein YncE